MNKNKFLRILNGKLQTLSKDDRKEILEFYEEYFVEKTSEGLSEQEICESLGDLNDIAKKAVTELGYTYDELNVRNTGFTGTKLILTILLLMFNLVFVVGLVGGLIGGLAGLFAGAMGMLVGSFGVFVTDMPVIDKLSLLALTFSGGILLLALTSYLSYWFFILLKRYTLWNIRVVKEAN